MDAHPLAATGQQLLTDAKALSRLAQGLLGRDEADDVVQSALAAALATPTNERQHLGTWLRGVVHKLALLTHRGNTRRRARERAAARSPIDYRNPAALAAEAEMIADVGAAVRALDEPFRSTAGATDADGWLSIDSVIPAHSTSSPGQPNSPSKLRRPPTSGLIPTRSGSTR